MYYSTTHLRLYVLTEISLLFLDGRNNPFLKDIVVPTITAF